MTRNYNLYACNYADARFEAARKVNTASEFMFPIFSIIALGGLCNRMRVMASTVELAQRMNRSCLFIWVRMPDMNSRFDDLFQNFPYPVIECTHRQFVMRILNFIRNHWKGTIIDDAYANLFSKKADWNSDVLNGKPVLVWTCENFLRTNNFEYFQMSPCLIKIGGG